MDFTRVWRYSASMVRVLEIEHLPIRLTERGQWLHGSTPMHPRVAALFARSILPHPDGRYSVVVGKDEELIDVEDAAFFVESMTLVDREQGGLLSVDLRLSDGREQALDPSGLMVSEKNVLYVRILRHGLLVPCRFPPSLYHRLALYVEEDPNETFVLPLGGRSWPIGSYDRRPIRKSEKD